MYVYMYLICIYVRLYVCTYVIGVNQPCPHVGTIIAIKEGFSGQKRDFLRNDHENIYSRIISIIRNLVEKEGHGKWTEGQSTIYVGTFANFTNDQAFAKILIYTLAAFIFELHSRK